MIEVEQLSKVYGSTPAIADVTFKVEPGEIVGFLGPNGAGKTTTMRILTGYLPATSGTARIAGYDVHEDSMAVRQRIVPQSLICSVAGSAYLRNWISGTGRRP